MAVSVSDLAALLQNISISSEPKSGLDELKNVLSTLRIDHIQNAGGELDLRILFDCLNSSSKEQVETSSDVLGRLLAALPATVNIQRYPTELDRALNHPTEAVKLLVLKQAERCITDENALKILKQHSGFLKNIISCIGCAESAPAAAAVRVVTSLARHGHQEALLVLSPPLLDQLRQTMATSDVVRYRGYEVAVSVACSSREGMKLVTDVGLLPALVQEAFGQDILVQLNALELLTTLSQSDHGFDHLESEGVTQRLEKLVTAPDEHPLHDYILPGVMKFFGQVGHDRPQHVLSRYPGFARAALAMVGHQELSRCLAALDTVACLGMTAAGKRALSTLEPAMTDCVTEIGRLAQNAPTELRVRALDTLTQLLQVKAADLTDDLLTLTRTWFSAVAPQPLDMIWSVARQPFLDLRLGALRLLAVVAALDWGQQMMVQRAGFVEYLLDRSTESSKEGRDAKYALVAALVTSRGAAQLPADLLSQLTTYHEQGAFYVRAQTEVALEESS
ncbi:26S proteasome non-ATPase regulatory subunit 5-like [Amphibalanus amphitrite]|uniref:26S proteasome non-ATPase regulatory subunit 5-like n=1 Tax=Amphibalanus amphitrite TaxID=1232801 RepID=UPI001C8FDA57|nr:26S proteasome non-ATPase regulatory subunit 5-like [Amphibalanus amphitrite]